MTPAKTAVARDPEQGGTRLWSRRRQLGLVLDDPRVLRACDAFLGVFEDLAPRSELMRLKLACRVAKLARVLTWQRAIEMVDAQEAAKLARVPLSWLASVLDSEYPGAARLGAPETLAQSFQGATRKTCQ
jgi:hypothetical protein